MERVVWERACQKPVGGWTGPFLMAKCDWGERGPDVFIPASNEPSAMLAAGLSTSPDN